MDVEIVGAIKIKDGLFLGDEFSAQVDFQFTLFYSCFLLL